MSYTEGRQPCTGFRPDYENVHECFGPYRADTRSSEERVMDAVWGPLVAPESHCHGTVSFCDNCHTDHHSGGWDTCPVPGTQSTPEAETSAIIF